MPTYSPSKPDMYLLTPKFYSPSMKIVFDHENEFLNFRLLQHIIFVECPWSRQSKYDVYKTTINFTVCVLKPSIISAHLALGWQGLQHAWEEMRCTYKILAKLATTGKDSGKLEQMCKECLLAVLYG
jgi:hypothetical protein